MKKDKLREYIYMHLRVEFKDGSSATGWLVPDQYDGKSFCVLGTIFRKITSFRPSTVKYLELDNKEVIK